MSQSHVVVPTVELTRPAGQSNSGNTPLSARLTISARLASAPPSTTRLAALIRKMLTVMPPGLGESFGNSLLAMGKTYPDLALT